jgi:uncharacterized repeat protein (TIGR01451 family)
MQMKKTAKCLCGGLLLVAAGLAHAGVDVQVDKSADNTRPLSGETVKYSIIVSNKGDADASGVKVLDQLPAGVSYIGDDDPSGQYNAATGVWDVGSVTVGGLRILNIIVLIN